jgi:hypothetical protein
MTSRAPPAQDPAAAPRIMYMYIFDRLGKLLFQRSWGPDARADPAQIDEHSKLVYGVVFSLKQMVPSLSDDPDAGLRSLSTSAFSLHVFETVTGFRLALCTSVTNPKQQGVCGGRMCLALTTMPRQPTPRPCWKTCTTTRLCTWSCRTPRGCFAASAF